MYEWDKAKDYYVEAGWLSGVSLKNTAERFAIPYQSVRRRAGKEQWRLIREWQTIEPELKTVEQYIYYYK